jgi:hypothetical protein
MKALLLCLAACSLFATAADTKKPDFSGDWKLNAAKSTASDIPGDFVFKIRHAEPQFVAIQEVGGEATEFKLGTDGKQYKNTFPNGLEMVTVMHWEGEVLVSDSKLETPDGTIKLADRLSLDGKSLKIQRKRTGADGDSEFTLIMDK